MKEEVEKNKANVWIQALWIAPALFLSSFISDIDDSSANLVAGAISFGTLAALGYAAYSFSQDKSLYVKLGLYAMLLLISMGTYHYLADLRAAVNQKLLTCTICGYKTLEAKGAYCELCMNEITESAREEGEFASLEELIKEEQLTFFSLEEEVDLNGPQIYPQTKYHKDENWEALITNNELDSARKEMQELEQAYPLNIKQGGAQD